VTWARVPSNDANVHSNANTNANVNESVNERGFDSVVGGVVVQEQESDLYFRCYC
jgi:hypothetical protein